MSGPTVGGTHQERHLHAVPVIPDRGSWRPPPRSRVGAHTIKRAVSVCPHFLASISRFRLWAKIENYVSFDFVLKWREADDKFKIYKYIIYDITFLSLIFLKTFT